MNANSSSKASPDERQGICLPKYGVIVWRTIASSSHSTRKRNTLTNVREFNHAWHKIFIFNGNFHALHLTATFMLPN